MGSYEDHVADLVNDLYDDTDYTLNDWKGFITFFASLMMARPPAIEGRTTSVIDRKAAVIPFCYMSAMYEWAARDWADTLFDSTGGSFGPFQAYYENIELALGLPNVKEALRRISDDGNARQAGLSPLTDDDKKAIKLAPASTKFLMYPYNAPILNMIGKVALSIYKAGLAKDANSPKPSPLWSLPDDVLAWVLMCYEGAGEEGNDDRAHQVNNVIKSLDEAGRTGDPDIVLHFGSLSTRRKPVADKLRISIRERCRYSELTFPCGAVPPWRTGETPPYR